MNSLNKPLVSVIMSVYKANKDHLKLSIESILNQSYATLEFLIVCDGELSALPIINGFVDHRIRIIMNNENKGLAYSMNKAIAQSKGDFIFRMDADDVSAFDRIETQLHYLLKGNKIVSSSCIEIDSQGREIKKSKRFLFHNHILNYLLYKTNRFNPVVHSSIAAYKEIFIEYKYDENLRYAQDYELWKRMSPKYKIFFIPKYLVYYRKGEFDSYKKEYQDSVSKKIGSED